MPREKSPEKRMLIINSAKKLFFSSFYPDVSMTMIADAASVSKSTLYGHFKNKEILFKAVLADHWQQDAVPSLNAHDTRDVADCLQQFSHEVMTFMYDHDTTAFFRILVAEATRFPDLTSVIIKEKSGPIQHSLRTFLKAKNLVPDSAIKEAALTYFALLYTDSFWHMLAGIVPMYTPEELKDHIDKVVPLYLHTLEYIRNRDAS